MNIMDMKPIKTTKPTWRNLIEKLEDAGQRNPDPKELIAEITILEQFYNLHLEKDNLDPEEKVLDFLKNFPLQELNTIQILKKMKVM